MIFIDVRKITTSTDVERMEISRDIRDSDINIDPTQANLVTYNHKDESHNAHTCSESLGIRTRLSDFDRTFTMSLDGMRLLAGYPNIKGINIVIHCVRISIGDVNRFI